MWRLWETESEEEQQWDKSASKGIPVLASDSDDNVIFIAKKPLPPLIEWPWVVGRAITGVTSDTSSSLGEYWLTIFIWLI